MNTCLQFFVHQDNQIYPVPDMNWDERDGIADCVKALIPLEYQFHKDIWFEVDMTVDDLDADEEPEYGLLKCFQHGKTEHPIPESLLNKLAGKTFTVKPRRGDFTSRIQLVFSAVEKPEPEPAVSIPQKGMFASELIKLALKH